MLLYVTGPREVDETAATAFYSALAAGWDQIVRSRSHPRTGAPLQAAVTRLDLFLAAFSPAPGPGPHGLRIAEPPAMSFMWGLSMRAALRELVATTFPPSARFGLPMDPVGPQTADPTPALPSLDELAGTLATAEDPAQKPVDPRLWLVVAPPLAPTNEAMFLPTFLRAEPFARLAATDRPLAGEALAQWLAGEVDALLQGRGLAQRGLVTRVDDTTGVPTQVYKDPAGRPTATITMLEAATGLEETYAWRTVLEPGQTYARLHSHTGSEEIYVVLEGEGLLRVNERILPLKAGDCFGKPRNYDCATQVLNPGPRRLVLLDFGSMDRTEVDLCRYPEHGELLARFGGHRWFVPTEAVRPGMELMRLYDRRYTRSLPGKG